MGVRIDIMFSTDMNGAFAHGRIITKNDALIVNRKKIHWNITGMISLIEDQPLLSV